ncbi:MAG TPA: BatA domain-containing protein [Caulifigura sp.]|nr:BatA domain-containing protein [Caulifigura sp.]
MGLLSPLYLFGLAALSLPIIFHLVRRTPKGRQNFSSLMFLAPTPPILTRRSRLDQVILLLLRLAALLLLAFAFARPFLRETATLPFDALPGRRLAILVDTSASMRRGDLSKQAKAAAGKVLDDLGPQDEVSLYAYGDRCRRVVGPSDFEASAESNQATVVKEKLGALEPDWTAGDLGQALVTVAGELDSSTDVEKSAADPEIVVITDAQQGNRVEALQAFEWPPRVRVSVTPVSLKDKTNAQVTLLETAEDGTAGEPRVRIASAADSTKEEFRIHWSSATGLKEEATVSAYVPPGQSRVVKLPRGDAATRADRILLEGDDQSFDNTCFVAPARREKLPLLYVGDDDPTDVNGQRYYLQLAISGDPLREIEISKFSSPENFSRESRLVVVNGALPEALATPLKEQVEKGAVAFFAPATEADLQKAIASIGGLSLETAKLEEKRKDRFSLLGQIDFSHPLFTAFANPRYSDFTKIHFWTRWPLKVDDDEAILVSARFDDGRPAVLERRIGKGRVILLAASWRPDDSQLALSSKFVPLIGHLLDLAYGHSGNLAGVVVNQPITLPEWRGQKASAIIRPDGQRVDLAGATEFRDTTEPGIYRAIYGVEELPCAVNLSASESSTAPMETAQLAQLGVRIGLEKTRVERADAIRQQRDTELEARQKLWRWGIIVLLGVLILETWWGGVRSRAPLAAVEVAT